MTTSQLAVRFSERQLHTLDELALRSGSTRSAVIKSLVDEAERRLIAEAYRLGYPRSVSEPDGFGDLTALHDESENERVAGRAGERAW